MENLFFVNEWNYRACYKKSAIKTLKLKQLSQMCDNLMWWYDYLTLISYDSDYLITCPCFKAVKNSSNNAQFFIPWSELEKCPFDFVNITLSEKGKVSTYMISVSYNNQPINLCRFVFFWSSKWNLMAQFDIYGKAWRLQSAMNNEFLIDAFIRSLILWNVNSLDMDDYINAFFTYYVSRADFRIDFWSKDKNFYDNIIHPYNLLKNKMSGKSEYYNKEWNLYTSKNVWKRENKYVYVRFYDKKQEISDDNTQFLYSDYYNYEWKIWRLEFQFMSRFTTARQKYNFWDIFMSLDSQTLTSQIFEYLWLSEKNGCFSKFYTPDDIPFDKLPLWKKKSIWTRLKHTLDYLIANGINPIVFIDVIYQSYKDDKWLNNFYDSINKYLSEKDIILPSVLNQFNKDDIDIIEK